MHIPVYRPFVWLSEGWRDMRRHWGASLGYGALIVALGWTLLVFCGTHPYFVAAAISGFLLVGPVDVGRPLRDVAALLPGPDRRTSTTPWKDSSEMLRRCLNSA